MTGSLLQRKVLPVLDIESKRKALLAERARVALLPIGHGVSAKDRSRELKKIRNKLNNLDHASTFPQGARRLLQAK